MRYKDITPTIYNISDLPGCSQVAVFHGVFVLPEYRGQGLGGAAHRNRLEHAKDLGYNAAICTVRSGNAAEIKILEKNGWRLVGSFLSSYTGGSIEVYFKEL